ncbi:ABC transporter permease [Deinococcus radiophilus]|uniref:ABC transporter permease n=1 Tax=Deinococcus radiophilus TaxID=32062 RepID=A0A431VUX5_9DEIO|nr:ABC transporter permease [Deinococcus radiophilus]RTR27036.1 ABC transporter permease [Deinococcus radiophilus]UFA50181.1 ABC transporter permease [Deinococcus radiophilus]
MNRARPDRPLGTVIGLAAAWAAFFWLVAQQELWGATMRRLFPQVSTPIYERNTLWELTWQHLGLTATAMGLVIVIGVGLGLWATRRQGREFLPLVNNLTTVGQTFPPIAVLFLALPLVGFGGTGAIAALTLYALLPVTRSTVLGLQAVEAPQLDAAQGLGLSPLQQLWRLEVPVALPAILSGIRTALVLTIATATLAPMVGTGGLGVPIIAGLGADNLALILQGAIPVALLALLGELSMRTLERWLTPWRPTAE